MPCASAAHAEAGDGDAVRIDVEALNRIIAAFEDIHLASGLPAIAVTSEGMDHDGARRLELTGLLRHEAAANEVEVRGGVTAAVEPDPHGCLLRFEVEPLGNFDAVGLRGVIELRVKAEHLLPAALEPRCLVVFQAVDALCGLIEQGICLLEAVLGLLVIPLVELEGIAQGFEENFRVCGPRVLLHRGEVGRELLQASLDTAFLLSGKRGRGFWWQAAFEGRGGTVRTELRKSSDGSEKKESDGAHEPALNTPPRSIPSSCDQLRPREVCHIHADGHDTAFDERKAWFFRIDEGDDDLSIRQRGVAGAIAEHFLDGDLGFDLVGDVKGQRWKGRVGAHSFTGTAFGAGGSGGSFWLQLILAAWRWSLVMRKSTARCSTVSRGFCWSSGSGSPAERRM